MRSRWWHPEYPFKPSRSPVFYGWIILVVSTLAVLITVPGQTIGVGVFTEIFMERLGLSRVQLSLAYLIGTAGSGLLLPWGGVLIDRFGTRRTIVWSSVLFGVVLIGLSQVDRFAAGAIRAFPTLPAALLGFLVISVAFFLIRFLGQGMLTISARTTLAKWFDRRRGLVLSLSGIAITLVFSVAPKVLDTWIRMVGWRSTYVILALLSMTAVAALGWLFIRDNPEECGLEMDGGYGPVNEKPNPDRLMVRDLTRAEALRTFSFWAFNIGTAWQSLLITAYTFHVISIGEEAGLSRDQALRLFIPMAFVGVASNFLSGWLADKTRAKYILILLTSCMAVAGCGLFLLAHPVGQILLVIGLGTSGGTFQTATALVWPRFYGRKHVGAISGVNMSTVVLASALGPFLFSLSKEWLGNYHSAYATAAVIPLALMIAAFFAENPQRKL